MYNACVHKRIDKNRVNVYACSQSAAPCANMMMTTTTTTTKRFSLLHNTQFTSKEHTSTRHRAHGEKKNLRNCNDAKVILYAD